jgi:hypothetical protein
VDADEGGTGLALNRTCMWPLVLWFQTSIAIMYRIESNTFQHRAEHARRILPGRARDRAVA